MALPGFTLRGIDSAIKPYEILSISSPGSEAALTKVFAIPSCFWLFCAGATFSFEKPGPEWNGTRSIFGSPGGLSPSTMRLGCPSPSLIPSCLKHALLAQTFHACQSNLTL